MTLREQLLCVSERYSDTAGRARSRVSTIVLGSGRRLDAIAEGGDLATGTFERAMQWFSDNWPADAVWPTDVPRPAPTPVKEAAE